MAIGHGGQVLLSTASAALVRGSLPPGTGLKDMGSHRLKDLAEAEGVFQLAQSGLPEDFPALRSLDSLPNNLPAQLTSFVGREKDLAEIKRLLGASRLLTITGSGGSGKTRLALQAAADVLDHFPDGAWLADMGPLTEGQLVPQTVATALGLHEEPGQPIQSTVLHWLSGKRLLLVVDNCEHLVDACARLAEAILRSCPHVQVLATSRAALAIGGETTWRIPSLGLADPDHLPPLEALTQYAAVRLFIERAVAAQSNFAVNNQNAPAVAQICHRLDGIPLAIELAAARVRVLSPDQIATRLDDRFQLLTGGSRTALPRQQTLRALVDWSHDLLSDKEKALFRRLSVFAGGWTLEAAEAVCAGDPIDRYEILDLLTALIDKSLIVAEDQESGQVRYRLLETLRQYARDRLAASAELETYEEAHMDTYHSTQAHPPRGRPGFDKGAWLDTVEHEHGNLRAALGQLRDKANAGDKGAAEEGLCLVKDLARFWFLRNYWSEARDWIRTFLQYSDIEQSNPALYAHVLFEHARFAHALGDYAELPRLAQESAELAKVAGNTPDGLEALCGAKWMQAQHALHTADYPGAERIAKEAVDISGRSGDTLLIEPRVTYAHALIHQSKGNDGVSALQAAVKEAQTAGDLYSEAYVQAMLGLAYISQKNLAEATKALDESIRIHRGLNGTWGAIATYWRGDVAWLEKDTARAERQYKEALEIGARVGARRFVANALRGLAAVQSAKGHHHAAAELLGASDNVRQAANTSWLPPEAGQVKTTENAAQGQLKGGYQAVWDAGHKRTMDQAIAYARSL